MIENGEHGIFSKVLSWLTKPATSGTVSQWLAGLVLVLIIAFLWRTVINTIE